MDHLETLLQAMLDSQIRLEAKLDHALERLGDLETRQSSDHAKSQFCVWVVSAALFGIAGLFGTSIWQHTMAR